MNFDIVDHFNANTHERTFKQKSFDIFRNMETTKQFARKPIGVSENSQFNNVDKHQKDIFYIIGDKVWISTQKIGTDEL